MQSTLLNLYIRMYASKSSGVFTATYRFSYVWNALSERAQSLSCTQRCRGTNIVYLCRLFVHTNTFVPRYKEKATELGNVLLKAFDPNTNLPHKKINMKTHKASAGNIGMFDCDRTTQGSGVIPDSMTVSIDLQTSWRSICISWHGCPTFQYPEIDCQQSSNFLSIQL